VSGLRLNASVGAPRLRAQIAGLDVGSVIHAELASRGSFKSSTFELTISITEGALNIFAIGLLTAKVDVKVFIYSRGSSAGRPVVEGFADSISVDQVNGTARLIGRDYSSVLIDSMFQKSYCNQTASEIAKSIAIRHGFEANIGATLSMAGSYQDGNYNQILLNAHSRIISEWDLLTELAGREQFELFLDGNTLVFSSAATLSRSNILIDVNSVMGIRFHRRMPLTDQTTLTVKSWNCWLGQALHQSSGQSKTQSTETSADFNDDPNVEIAIIRPNLTSQGAEQLAVKAASLLNEQNLTVQVTTPGDTTIKPLDLMTVTGSDSAFDSDYIVTSVRRQFSTTSGFVQYIQGTRTGVASLYSSGFQSASNG